jgi:hypothetical protein
MDSQYTYSDDSEFSSSTRLFCFTTLPASNLYFKPLLSDISMAVREVKGMHLGKLITVRGIVTRVSEVKPLLLVNAYTCDVCGSETFQEISRKEFTPIADCQNENECVRNNIKGSLHMQTRACRFSPFQEVKIQEMVFALIFFSCKSFCSSSPPGRSGPCWSYPPIHDRSSEWQSHTHDESRRPGAFRRHLPSYSLHWLPGCPRGSPYRHVCGGTPYTPTQKAV